MNMSKKRFLLIFKVANLVVGFLLLVLVWYAFSSKQYLVDDVVVEYAVSMHYDFKIIDSSEDSFFNFDGMTREGKRVKFKIPKVWNLKGAYSVGDSIFKVAGDSILRVVKPNETILLQMNVK